VRNYDKRVTALQLQAFRLLDRPFVFAVYRLDDYLGGEFVCAICKKIAIALPAVFL
jgi:hypothetical protein